MIYSSRVPVENVSPDTSLYAVLPAVPTPCLEVGQPSAEGMRALASHLTSAGCSGLFILGSTGEMVLLDEEDRRALVRAAQEGMTQGSKLYVGVGGFGPKMVTRYTRLAATDGADVAVVMAPFFQKLTQRELTAAVEQIADASPIPIGLYHHLRMPTAFEVDTVARLAEHPNVVTFKDTSVDLNRMEQLVSRTRGTGLQLLQGSEKLIFSSLQLGAHGCVSALASVAPEWHSALVGGFARKEFDQAEVFQKRIGELTRLFQLRDVSESLSYFVHTMKYALWLRGIISSPASLLPGVEPTSEFEEQIRTILDELSLPVSTQTIAGQDPQ